MDIYKYGKNLRCGYTTGACAAAAAGAAARLLLSGQASEEEELLLNGQPASFLIESAGLSEEGTFCGVRKDAGDDIDVTDGMLILAEVKFCRDTDPEGEQVIIQGGQGVGRVTKPGLDQAVGQAAINSGPRRMIRAAVSAVMEEYAYSGSLAVTISVPGGQEIAEKTFNPVLGIEGGISILGSTGIVEPMSEPAIVETIKAEMRVKWLEICKNEVCDEKRLLALVPGNYGISFVKDKLGIGEECIIKCSNFIGQAIDSACGMGVGRLLIAGNLGKLVKLAGGIFNTHSRNADARMDILIRAALKAEGLEAQTMYDLLMELDSCITTDAAVDVLRSYGILEEVMKQIIERAAYYVKRRAGGTSRDMEIQLIMVSNAMDVLGSTVLLVPGQR